jgi:GH18 family chitinase
MKQSFTSCFNGFLHPCEPKPKNKIFYILLLITCLSSTVAVAQQKKVVAYIPAWSSAFDVSGFDYSKVTHLQVAFLMFQQNPGKLWTDSDFASISFDASRKSEVDGILSQGLVAKAHTSCSKGAKVLVSIGGATDNAFTWLLDKYHNDDAKMEEIAQLLAAYINANNLDGVDLDLEGWGGDASIGKPDFGGRTRGDAWGSPDVNGPHPAALGMTNLAAKLKALLPGKLVTCAVLAAPWYGLNYDKNIANHVDWIGLMTYDYTGAWGGSPEGPHSALNKIPLNTYPGQTPDQPIFSAEEGIKLWLGTLPPSWNHAGGIGVPVDKLLVGIPFYGIDFATKTSLTYSEIVTQYPGAETSFDLSHPADNGGNVNKIYYDTPELARKKTRYACDNGLQGVLVWEVTQDVPVTDSRSLLKAINDEVCGQAPSLTITSPADNALFTAPATVTVSATATDSDGIFNVTFKYKESQDATWTSLTTTGSYAATLSNLQPGTYTISAVAIDNKNDFSVSCITVVVKGVCSDVADYTPTGGYSAGSVVVNAGKKYQCKPWPFSGWCNGAPAAYAPGTGSHWESAWIMVESCSGVIDPVCPQPQYTANGNYTAGSKVSNNGASYECKPWPFSGWCSAGPAYAPGTGFAWEDAWTYLGACNNVVSSSSITNQPSSEISIYPTNPRTTGNIVTVGLDKTYQSIQVSIGDMEGSKEYVYTFKNAKEFKLTCPNLSKGVNVIKITADNNSWTEKLFID